MCCTMYHTVPYTNRDQAGSGKKRYTSKDPSRARMDVMNLTTRIATSRNKEKADAMIKRAISEICIACCLVLSVYILDIPSLIFAMKQNK